MKAWYPQPGTRLGATFYVRQSQPWLRHYFGGRELEPTLAPGIGGIVLWGGRIPAKAARAVAAMRRLPAYFLEDGLLRSVGLGKENTLPISIQVDDLAPPLRVSLPSRLEYLIAASAAGEDASVGAQVRDALVHHRLSKYNNLPHCAPTLPRTSRRRVLLIDQVVGDVSVPMAGGSKASFDRMLDDALRAEVQCVVRTHPDVMAGFRKGYLTEAASRAPGVVLTAEPVSAASILEVVDEVWTVSSQFGLDALLRGLPVRCYAGPFYAGWGLTEDRLDVQAEPIRRRQVARPSVEQLAAAAFVHYPTYRDTSTWDEIDVFGAIERLLEERRQLAID